MPTTYMGLELPTEDGSSDLWDSLLNDALEVVDAHDHSNGKGVTVKTAGLEINADLTFGGYAATALKAAAFSAVATSAVSALSKALFVNSADSELYWRTSGGVNVKLTAGTSLNTALIGGFTGDYGAGAEEAEFTSASGIFDFRVGATERAYIDCSDIRLFQKSAGITNAVKLKSPAALAASYTLTFPDALPGSTSMLMVSSTGAITATRNPTLDDITCDDITADDIGCDSLVATTGVTAGIATLDELLVTGLLAVDSGVIQLQGEVSIQKFVTQDSIISPTALSGNTDNWNPTGLANASLIRISSSAAYNLTGIVAPSGSKELLLVNVGTFTITLKDEITSTAANRFVCPGGVDVALVSRGSVRLWYDLTSTRWRPIGKSL